MFDHTPPIRLLIAEADDAVRQALAQVLSWAHDVQVVGLAEDGAEAVRRAEELHPDVVLIGLDMPRLGAADATRWITSLIPGVRVVGLSTQGNQPTARPLLEAGAVDCLTDPARFDELLWAVRAAAGR